MTVVSGDHPVGSSAGPRDDADLRARQHRVLAEFELLDMPLDAELDAVTRVAAVLAAVPLSTINLLDTERQCSIAATGFERGSIPREESMCHRASRVGGVVLSRDASLDERFADLPWVDGRSGSIRLYAAAPLVVEGVTIGTLCVLDDQPGDLTQQQLDRLADLASVVVALLERRRDQRVSEAGRRSLARALDELARAQAFDRALLDALPVGVATADLTGNLTLFNREGQRWHGGAGVSPADLGEDFAVFRPDGRPLPPDELPLRQVLRTRQPVELEMVLQPKDEAARLVACSGMPVQRADGSMLGAVVTMADITQQRALEEQLRTAARHDALTGLPNRTLLMDRLEHALATSARTGGPVAVLYCDLDGFKAVNDEHGHAAGDDVLVETAQRLAGAVRPGDTVGRIGGDEFVLLCVGVGSEQAADAIADRVVAAMAGPMAFGSARYTVGISIGVAMSGPGATPEAMVTAADEAMYRVKRARHGTRPQG